MGDAADLDFEQGFEGWLAHLRRECEGPCPYCDEEDDREPESDDE